jgi:hypothetical protein
MASTLGTLLPRQRTGHIYLAIAVGVAAVSAIAATRGQIGWGLTEGSLCIAVVLYLLPWLTPRRRECVQVDDTGVIVLADQGRDEVRWDAVTQIRIMTTAGGPWAEDVYFVLDAEGGKGCVVPHDAVVRTKLLEEIQTRFRGVDDRKVIEAMGCTSTNMFVIWDKNRHAVESAHDEHL